MIHDVFVIDGVGHAMDFSDGNVVDGVPRETIQNFRSFAHSVFVGQLESEEPGYRLTVNEWANTHSPPRISPAPCSSNPTSTW